MNELNILNVVNKIKSEIIIQIEKKNYNMALFLISNCANILYSSNIYYYDADLEKSLYDISKSIIKNATYRQPNSDCILFYDGFGMDFRGLAQIYLKALCNTGKKIVYVTYRKFINRIPSLTEILSNGNSEIICMDEEKGADKILRLNNLVMSYRPRHFFFYSYPNDAAIAFLYVHQGNFCRYLINLTDHAFWLGANAIDYFIEFRDYGAAISMQKRNIPEDKLVMLPYYPLNNSDTEFKGYPFKYEPKKQRIIFSGGSLYKTFGDNNKYYNIVRHILDNYKDVIFWYAGFGDKTEMNKLMSEYKGRVYLTEERPDLVQVLKHSYLYLSTYPICGGLMFQYAALAGKIPLTLSFDKFTDGFLLNQHSLGIQFDNLNDLYAELDRLMTDAEYLHKKEELISKSIITEKDFENGLNVIMEQKKSLYPINYVDINYEKIKDLYLQNYKYILLCNEIAIGHKLINLKLFPKEFIIGILCHIHKKLKLLK